MRLVGVDTGGTFTDLVFLVDGAISAWKIPSTPDDPARAVLEGIARFGNTGRIVHGSTVATNTFLERKGARVVFYTTEGFEDLVEIGRQNRGKLYDLDWTREPPLVPRKDRIGVRERIGPDGKVIVPLGRISKRKGTLAVGFLHSYANPEHERAAARRLGGDVTLSSDVLPEYREYERFSTTVLNAYVRPVMSRYVGRLRKKLGDRLSLMSSAGGTISAEAARERPVHTLLSGPAGGISAALTLGRKKWITFDMGGTSTDVAVIDGSAPVTKEGTIGGYPLRVPILDIHTIGAGGGSVAWFDDGGALRVGPESAGARPGPVCYGHGGRRATVTDANAVLGRIDPEKFLGGRMPLDVAAAKREVTRTLAKGILEVANSNMERALRRVSLERGHDPADFFLLAFGGAGPLHACDLAGRLGMKGVIVPRWPGLFSAFGMVFADAVVERSRTAFRAVAGALRLLEKEVLRELPGARLSRFVEMRYQGQSYELRVPWSRNPAKAFHLAHRKRYGYVRDAKVESVTAVVQGRVPGPKFRLDPLPDTRRRWKAGRHLRADFGGGDRVPGPSIISEDNATTWVPKGWNATVARDGSLEIVRVPTR